MLLLLEMGSRLVQVAIEEERLGRGGRWGPHLSWHMRRLLLLLVLLQMPIHL